MKTLIKNYVFFAASRQIIFTDYSIINLENILLITNVTHNTIIYNFANPLQGGTVNHNILTLTYDTSTMSIGDLLQIYYDDNKTPSTEETLLSVLENVTGSTQIADTSGNTINPATNESILDLKELTNSLISIADNMNNSVELLKILRKMLEASATQDAFQRQKIVLDAITANLTLATVGTVNTVTTVSTVTTVGTVNTVTNSQSLGGVDYRWQMIDQARSTYANSIRNNLTF